MARSRRIMSAMTNPVDFNKHSLELLIRAKRDLYTAQQHRIWYNAGNKTDDYNRTNLDSCAYNLQQSVEKILKSIMSFSCVNYEYTHNIVDLAAAVNADVPAFKINNGIKNRMVSITQWETIGRYGGFPFPAKDIFDTIPVVMTLFKRAVAFTGFLL